MNKRTESYLGAWLPAEGYEPAMDVEMHSYKTKNKTACMGPGVSGYVADVGECSDTSEGDDSRADVR